MTLDQWLSIATRGLAASSIEQVRREIQDHAQSALEHGQDPIASLGDPTTANREYRKVLLTGTEDRYLKRLSGSEAGLGRRFAKVLMIEFIFGLAIASTGNVHSLYPLVPLLVAFTPANLLPDWKPSVAKYVRWIRWTCSINAAVLLLWFGPNTPIVPLAVLVILARMELIRASIRRKLPPHQWPANLAG